ncbi:MAG: hypothetical protein IJT34_04165 [Butyrivibrio sp.]|nr:hypothetical protein [Butyrivibrio sp.]
MGRENAVLLSKIYAIQKERGRWFPGQRRCDGGDPVYERLLTAINAVKPAINAVTFSSSNGIPA